MAETELTALLVESGALHGVRLARGRGGPRAAAANRWPMAAPPPPAGGDAPAAPADPAADPLAAALCAAQRAWRMEAGCALALPTSELMLKVLSLPPADPASLAGMVRLQMEKIAPCSGEDLVVGHEILSRGEAGQRVFAAAVPRAKLDALAQQLAAAGLRLTRLDAALLGWWRQLSDLRLPALAEGRVAVLFEQGGQWDLLLVEANEPLLARGLGLPWEPPDLGRELTLSLLQAEMEAGPAALSALLVVAEQTPAGDWLAALQAAAGVPPQYVPRERLGSPALGVALRDGETGRLDLVPDVWRAQEHAQRARRRFLKAFGAAALLWLLLTAALLLAPSIVRRATAGVAARIAARETVFREASDVRLRVRLIRSYMDRSRSLLEALRSVCEVMPAGVELSALTYRREEGVKLQGDAAGPALVYAFKDALEAAGVFAGSKLNGVTLDAARRRHRFEIDARFDADAPAGGGG